ncbi:App1 family protein [Aureimonas populi]|uniref:App1 family protein n=1 Tax=Aureimonas populi TaxID=1701758 RepID=A0ABW5CRN3_9HYPH|nr:phosphatase domain-containing protein [Aureimonas populi]
MIGRLRAARFALKRRLRLTDRPTFVAYTGFVEGGCIRLKGRVLEDEGVFDAPHSNSAIRNLWLTFKRYETDEIVGAKVSWDVVGQTGSVVSGEDGYFEIGIEGIEPPPGSGPWLPVQLKLETARHYEFEPKYAEGAVRLVSPRARFGIISDIDDTIIHTGAFKMLRHWRIVTANSPEARTAFPGVSHFYRALCEGADGPQTNPIFYVSSSPWNLFDIFERFMALKGIPRGPMLLRNLSEDAMGWLMRRHHGHKDRMIDRLMEAYPHLNFVLIGDSGQRDSSVYAQAVERHKGRVVAVHIHDVRPGEAPSQVEADLERIEAAGVPTTLGRTLSEAARLAERLGLAASGTLEAVEAEIAAEDDKSKRFGRFPVIVQP